MATIRESLEAREFDFLAPEASKSAKSRGRLRPEPDDPIRPMFQRDRDRIIHSKAFRRLKHKTQVFFAPTGDHYRTRLTHTLEACFISRTVANSSAKSTGAAATRAGAAPIFILASEISTRTKLWKWN